MPRHKDELAGIAETSDPAGHYLVNHEPHLDSSKLDEDTQESARIFKRYTLDNETNRNVSVKDPDEAGLGGFTTKAHVKILPLPIDNRGRAEPHRLYMVKPYFENMKEWPHAFYPLAGWAEMTTRHLLHAADLGHMAMKVHAFEHEDKHGARRPLLAIELEPDLWRAGDIEFDNPVKIPMDIRYDAGKLAAMDFLANHQDRHGGNLLVQSTKGPTNFEHEDEEITRLLAIDNGFSFQYRFPNRFHVPTPDATVIDGIHHYLRSPAFTSIDADAAPVTRHVAKWWPEVRSSVISEFRKQLALIEHAPAKEHLWESFKDRVAALDRFCKIMEKDGHSAFKKGVNRGKAGVTIRHHVPDSNMFHYADPDIYDEWGDH